MQRPIEAPLTTTGSVLRALASVPLDSGEAQTFLQRRVAFFARVFAMLVTCFIGVGLIVTYRSGELLYATLGQDMLRGQLAVFAGFGAIWLRTRTGKRSELELRSLDALQTILPSLITAYGIRGMSPHLRPDLLISIVLAHVLMGRALIIPSSARRSLLLGAACIIPLTVLTQLFYDHHHDPTLPPSWLYSLATAAWGVASVVVSSLASYTIFGLRQRVMAATQLGQYTLESRLGQGGMGVVYRARHALLRRPTAIKLLSAERSSDHDLARFEREVQLTSQLTHPNTISIYDYGRTPEGVFYYAMEYLDGIDLQQLVEWCGPQSPACVARILEQVAGALAEAHARGLIHRDIKPANVILCERGGLPGVAKVVDFGLVKSTQNVEHDITLSATHSIMGTPLYLSPEAIARPDAVDARSDLYALGAVAYFLLSGAPVFAGATIVEICGHHLYTAPAALSGRPDRAVPADLDALILRLLAKEPADRVASAQTLVDELAKLSWRASWRAAEAREWWATVIQARDSSGERRRSVLPAGSSQTVAVDLRLRKQG